jgi:mRNA interferase MazF
VIVQSNAFNASRIRTIVPMVVTSDLRLLDAPGNVLGNVLLPARASGLPRDSVANVSQVVTFDREALGEHAGSLDVATMREVGRGLRLVMQL